MGKWKLVRPFVTHIEPDGESEEKALLYNLKKTLPRNMMFPRSIDGYIKT